MVVILASVLLTYWEDPVDAVKEKTPNPKVIPLTEGDAKGEVRSSPPGSAKCKRVPVHLALYNPRLRPNAQKLRKKMTQAELCLWKYVLKGGMVKGYTFNRQRPVLRYIADFMCKPLKLIIEVDGGYHDNPKTKRYDKFRQQELELCGFTFLRFRNEEVLQATDLVRNRIVKCVSELEGKLNGDLPKRVAETL